MEIPSTVLKNLRCSNCEAHLSCAPILISNDGENLCGRCTPPETDVQRNKPYEELAQLMKFPCKYQENGCTQLLLFSLNKTHENACEYRPYICPVAPSGKCEWIGLRADLLEHCKKDHSTQVLQNPSVLEHQITKASFETFLMSAFNVLFLIHAKVCVTTRKIYHSVRLIGDPACATHYEYNLDIKRNAAKFSKRKEVAPQECLALKENASLATGINSLLEMLGGFNGTTFTISVQKIFENKSEQVNKDIDSSSNQHSVSEKKNCKYHSIGCMYKGYENNIEKHELYFCQYSIWCSICANNFVSHCVAVHKNITHTDGSIWAIETTCLWQWCIISAEFGNALCNFWQDVNGFHIRVFTSLNKERLLLYRFMVEISNPVQAVNFSRKPKQRTENLTDWYAEFSADELNNCISNKQFNIKIKFHCAI